MSELIARGKQPGTAVIYIRKVGSSIRDINFPVHVSMKAKTYESRMRDVQLIWRNLGVVKAHPKTSTKKAMSVSSFIWP